MPGRLPTCLLCAVSLAVMKESNLKRHYETKHSKNFDFLTGATRRSKIESLQRSLTEQQSKFLQHTSELKNTTRASFAVSELIGKRMKPFTDGEFVKECLLTVADIICPEKRDLFDIRTTLQERAQQFELYAIALDESTDATDIALVAIFVRGINATFDITEELASLVSLKDTTTGENIFQGIMSVIGSLGLNLSNICGGTTDGAPAMIGKVKGAVSLIEKEMRNAGIERKLVKTHCIIHLEPLCAKSLKMQEEKGMEVPELSDAKWMTDFSFLVDITNHLNMLNLKIQGMNQFINVLYEHIYAFEVKLQLWELQLKESNCINFPTLRSHQPCDVSCYAEFISDLKDQFNTRFADMDKHCKYFSYFAAVFDVEICDAPENLQMELIELQSSSELRSRFRDVPLLEFYQHYITPQRFPSLMKHAKEVAVLFGSTYVCAQLFSKMKYIKSKLRTRLSENHLDSVLRLATSNLKPDIEALSKVGQYHPSHQH
ncbi:General transcription factor II-I repeat domain-containing protein 2A-like [Oopsacas minuta]|uniref:General transcription factor II-I repeat domain-containing protein 2A-like n=1 Tax=Oopsacas minuta TaxID=111878 RepID=A0AAV7JVS5_9METZ|nr:General transcription factor II-I repeat domain-containing protein 2A-like [Oopsacas minuta]